LRAVLTLLLVGVSAANWPLVLALGLSLMWLWWVMDTRGIAAVKGRQVDTWTAVALLTGPLGWLVVKVVPAAKPPRAREAYAAAQSFRERHGLAGGEGARVEAMPVYTRRRGQAEGRAG